MTPHLVTFSDASMSRAMVGIYKITSPSGYVYIGQSWNVIKRWRGYRKSSEVRRQPFIDASIRKHGLAAHVFEILFCLIGEVEQADLDAYEQHFMDAYRALGFKLMNAREAGSRGKLGADARAKISRSQRGRKASAATRLALSLSHRGLKKSDTHKRNIGLAHKGRPSFVKAFQGERNLKAKLTPEQVLEIRSRHIPQKKGNNKRMAQEFGVSVSTIERITGHGKGGTWLHL